MHNMYFVLLCSGLMPRRPKLRFLILGTIAMHSSDAKTAKAEGKHHMAHHMLTPGTSVGLMLEHPAAFAESHEFQTFPYVQLTGKCVHTPSRDINSA